MARDLGIFAVLARSVDLCAGEDVRHVVVVPRSDLPAFARFATQKREILAQEDLLPMRLFALPKVLGRLAFLHDALRRPLYVTGKGQVTRGWMIQQLLKIEYARQSPAASVVHVDSDVFFVRPFTAADALTDGRLRLFRAQNVTLSAAHRRWTEIATICLGLDPQPGWSTHYIENCVPWSRDVAEAMVKRIEKVHGRPYHEVLLAQPTISEYFIYGLFADLLAEPGTLAAGDLSICQSFWPRDETESFDLDRQLANMKPWHRALSVQSTHSFSVEARERACRDALARLQAGA